MKEEIPAGDWPKVQSPVFILRGIVVLFDYIISLQGIAPNELLYAGTFDVEKQSDEYNQTDLEVLYEIPNFVGYIVGVSVSNRRMY